MISVHAFTLVELWKQLCWVYQYDDLDDAFQLAPAIRYHPDLTDDYRDRFSEFLAEILIDSIRRRSLRWIRFSLDEGSNLTPFAIHQAIFHPMSDDERIPLFDTFVERGWNVNSIDHNGAPFIHSVTHSPTLVSWFISHGADPNVIDPRTNRSTLDVAAQFGTLESLRLLLTTDARLSSGCALQLAISRAEIDSVILPILELLLDQQVCISDVDPELDTALHAAVWRGSLPRARLLLERGANSQQPGLTRPPAVQFARELGNLIMEQFLSNWSMESSLPQERRNSWIVVDDAVALEAENWEAVNHGLAELTMADDTFVEHWEIPGLDPTAPRCRPIATA